MIYENKVNDYFKKMNELFSVESYKEKFIVIFGMNDSAKIEIAYFHHYKIKIGAFVDNDVEKQGLIYNTEVIRNPSDVLKDLPENTIILISAEKSADSITKDILKYNPEYKKYIIYLDIYKFKEIKNDLTDKSNLKKIDLKEIQQENLKMLSWFYDLCKKNNLKCYLSYGTLLGAVRHHGFIPWDDDVDVSMPFPDYIKLHEIMKHEQEYSFDSMLNCESKELAISTIAKLKSKKIIVEDYNFPLHYEDYLAIDIWPLSGYPNDEKESVLYYRELQELADEWKENVVIPYGTDMFNIQTYKSLVNRMIDALGRYDFTESDFVSEVYCGYLGHIRRDLPRRGLKKVLFEETVQMPFEGKIFEIPEGYDEILKVKYGSYMEIPSDGERRIHDFSNSAYFINDKEINRDNIDSFDRDTIYWNDFYNKTKNLNHPSLFAQMAIEHMQYGESVVEIGCGNGRDSLFFKKNGISVTAVDASDVAIEMLKSGYNGDNINFVCDDFVSFLNSYKGKFTYCYSRFTMHAINEEQEDEVIQSAYNILLPGGMFFIETRSVNDDIYGLGVKVARNSFEYEGHFRRFIVLEEFVNKLEAVGFKINYSEEKRGFAPFKETDPPIIRIIARK